MVLSMIQVRDRFTKRRDRKSCFLQRDPVGFERVAPAGKMHAQAVALLHTFEALPAEVSPFDDKRGVGLRAHATRSSATWDQCLRSSPALFINTSPPKSNRPTRMLQE